MIDYTLRKLLGSASSSLFNKDELIQKILVDNPDIIERAEFKNRFGLLVKKDRDKYRKVGDFKCSVRRESLRDKSYRRRRWKRKWRDEYEEKLREFDMNMAYGPSVGMTRIDRWNRANKLGSNPPIDIYHMLTSDYGVCAESMWHGRV